MPNKTEICQYLDKLSPAATAGRGGQYRGQRRRRTDRTYHRWHRLRARPLAKPVSISSARKMTVLGAGGAANGALRPGSTGWREGDLHL
ncbi:hypothetical protein LN650_27490 [Klebsiella pneumoniae subsp. pneumoniae]|nr:hypothetical protein [Klebsiella pneumoniae subsp. pneumoniae]